MNKEFIKTLEKALKKEPDYECTLNLSLEELYKMYDKYGYTFVKSTYEMSHFIIDGTYLIDTVKIGKER